MVDDDIAMFAVAYPDGATSVCQGNTVLLISEYSGDDVMDAQRLQYSGRNC